MKFGFEREFFVKKGDTYTLATDLPHDDCGYLAEVRGEPHTEPAKALALYHLEEDMLYKKAEKKKLELELSDYVALPSKFRNYCLRKFGKNVNEEGSMYGKFSHHNLSTAGLHVHFSDEKEVVVEGRVKKIPGILDMPRWIYGLDKFFAQEIKAAKRVPGLYEMKPHGFEYRSLPASVDMGRVVKALEILKKERWNSSLSLDGEDK